MSTLKVGTIQDHANSNTAMTIDSSGRVFQPAKPYISLFHTVDTDYAAAATISNFTVAESRGITHSGGVMTVPVTGQYMIYFCGIINTAAGVLLNVGGANINRIVYTGAGGTTWDSVSGQHIMTVTANTEVKFVAVNGTVSMYGATSASGKVGGAGMYLIG
tara:strand:- start:722 stop:1204 length:483 start_codon:yes stop_codon:yes gene_type:complete